MSNKRERDDAQASALPSVDPAEGSGQSQTNLVMQVAYGLRH